MLKCSVAFLVEEIRYYFWHAAGAGHCTDIAVPIKQILGVVSLDPLSTIFIHIQKNDVKR